MTKRASFYPNSMSTGVLAGLITSVAGLFLYAANKTVGVSLFFIGGGVWLAATSLILLLYLKKLLNPNRALPLVNPKQADSSKSLLKALFKTQRKDMENFVRLLEVNTDEELAEHLIYSALARVENPTLSDEFLNNLPTIPLDEVHKVKAQLQMINLQFKSDLTYAPFMAGNVIWIMTLRSVEGFEHLLLAKRMWKELQRGQQHIKSKLDELEIEVPENEMDQFYFTPRL